MGEGAGLDCEAIEFVIAGIFLFLPFFLGGGVLEHPVFLNNISTYFPDANWSFYDLLIFPFGMYFSCCSLVTYHLIFP